MDYLLGNRDFKSAVKNMVLRRNVPNSVLITGEEGIGKKTAARYLSAALLCREKKGTPCGECVSCRKIFSDIHPDVVLKSPSSGGQYLIDQIRDIRSDCSVVPGEAERKIYIIEKADKMNLNSANAFLKCLEEPPEHTVFVLLAEDEKKLIPTVLSRVIRFRLSPVSRSDFSLKVENQGRYDIVGGNIGKGLALSEEETLAEKIVLCMLKKDGYEFMRSVMSVGYMKAPAVETVLSGMTVIMKNGLLYKNGIPVDKTASEVGKNIPESDIYALLSEIEEMRKRNSRNVSATGIFTRLFLSIK